MQQQSPTPTGYRNRRACAAQLGLKKDSPTKLFLVPTRQINAINLKVRSSQVGWATFFSTTDRKKGKTSKHSFPKST
jgi:hypothetical protein